MAKTKLTPELQEQFCKAIENGDSILGACGYVGISEQTYYNWINRAEEAKTKTKFVKFKECVDKAKAKALHHPRRRWGQRLIGRLQHGCWKEDILTCMVRKRKLKLMLIIKVYPVLLML